MPRSPITEQYQRLMLLVEQLHALPEDERNFVLDLFAPLPEPEQKKPAGKKASKRSSKSAQSSTKSPRASSLHGAIKGTAGSSAIQPPKDVSHCVYLFDSGEVCDALPVDPIHDETFGYVAYHPFQPAASPAPTRSPANGGAESTTANSATETEDAGSVAHGASGD